MIGLEGTDRLDVVAVRLVKQEPILSGHKIETAEDAVAAVGDFLCELDREVLCVINMKSDGTPVSCNFASVGVLNGCTASAREIFKSSILSNAAFMLLVHNHPSGSLVPSKEDTMLTDRMVELCAMMDIPLMDHVIVGGDNWQYFSFREQGILINPHHEYCMDYRKLSFDAPKVAERAR